MRKVHCLKLTGLAFLSIPLIFLLLFAFGEGSSGFIHFFESVPLIFALIFAWKYPRIIGLGLIILSVVLGSMYMTVHMMISVKVFVECILFFPMCFGGILLMVSSYTKTKH